MHRDVTFHSRFQAPIHSGNSRTGSSWLERSGHPGRSLLRSRGHRQAGRCFGLGSSSRRPDRVRMDRCSHSGRMLHHRSRCQPWWMRGTRSLLRREHPRRRRSRWDTRSGPRDRTRSRGDRDGYRRFRLPKELGQHIRPDRRDSTGRHKMAGRWNPWTLQVLCRALLPHNRPGPSGRPTIGPHHLFVCSEFGCQIQCTCARGRTRVGPPGPWHHSSHAGTEVRRHLESRAHLGASEPASHRPGRCSWRLRLRRLRERTQPRRAR